MRQLVLFLGLALSVASASLIHAAGFDGNYAHPDCSNFYGDGKVVVRGSQINFHESVCDLRNPVSVRDMGNATLYDVDCAGEGEQWTTRFFLMRDSNANLVIVDDRGATTFPRCQ